MIIAITHPTMPKIRLPCFFMSAALEVFSKHLDQEVGDDVRKNNRENTAGGTNAHIELLNTQRINQECQVGGGMSGTARSGGVNLGKNRKQKDRLNHYHDADRPLQVRNDNKEKHLNRVCPVDRRGFLLLGI